MVQQVADEEELFTASLFFSSGKHIGACAGGAAAGAAVGGPLGFVVGVGAGLLIEDTMSGLDPVLRRLRENASSSRCDLEEAEAKARARCVSQVRG